MRNLAAAALAGTPLVASTTSCQNQNSQNQNVAQNQNVSQNQRLIRKVQDSPRPSTIDCDAGGEGETHIPPVGIGPGSFQLETRNEIVLQHGGPPYVHQEVVDTMHPSDSCGDINYIRVIAENTNSPMISDVTYLLEPASELFLWYSPLSDTPVPYPPPNGDYDCMYPPTSYDDNHPDVRIKGGPLTVTVTRKPLESKDYSHKCSRPYLYRHTELTAAAPKERHFRIGKWRITQGGVIVRNYEDAGAEAYYIFIKFNDGA
jgi:hypothetical protein